MLERIAAGRTDLVLQWVAGGGDPGATADDMSLIAWCAYYGDTAAVCFLHGHGQPLSLLGLDLGLHNASFHGHWRLCEYLLAQGADARSRLADTGETPLHAALCKFESLAHERVVEVLLAAGADVSAATVPGVATGTFMRDVRTRGETALHRAAAYGTAGVIKRLLDAGANREAGDANGDSPLSWASWALRDGDILRMLCFGPHRLHPEWQPMKVNLIGWPVRR